MAERRMPRRNQKASEAEHRVQKSTPSNGRASAARGPAARAEMRRKAAAATPPPSRKSAAERRAEAIQAEALRLANERRRREEKKKAEARRKKLQRAAWTLLVSAVLLLGMFFSVNLIFKVENYKIKNPKAGEVLQTGVYSEENILSALNVPQGSNLFSFSAKEKAKAMQDTMIFMESVKVTRELPGTVVVTVEPAVPTYCLQGSFGWAELSQGLRVLTVGDVQPQGLVVLEAQFGVTPAPGMYLEFLDESAGSGKELRKEMELLVQLLKKEQLWEGVKALHLNDSQEMSVNYEDRIQLKLGTANRLDYKMKFAGTIIRNEDGNCIGETERGTLDVSHPKKDGTIDAVFQPENSVDITDAMNSPPPTPSPTPTPEPEAPVEGEVPPEGEPLPEPAPAPVPEAESPPEAAAEPLVPAEG